MAYMSKGGCRIRDVVRDSKILGDIPSRFNQKTDAFMAESYRASTGLRRHLEYDYHRVGRDFPRVSTDGICYEFTNQHFSFRETNKRCNNGDFASSLNEEGDSGFYGCNRSDAYFQKFQQVYGKSESERFKFLEQLPTFDGSSLKLDLFDWGDAIEEYFAEMNPPEALKCKIATSKLEGFAHSWWKEVQNNRVMRGKHLISSWDRMMKLLISKFEPRDCSMKCPLEAYSSSFEENNVCKVVDGLYYTNDINWTEGSNKEVEKSNDKLTKDELAESVDQMDVTLNQLTKCVLGGHEVEAEHEPTITVKVLDDVSQASGACFILTDVPKLDRPLKYVSPTYVVPVNPSNLKTMIPVSLVNGLGSSSNISIIGSETGFAIKIYNTIGEQSQRQIRLEPSNVDFPVGEIQVVNFDPGGVASQHKFTNDKALSTTCCHGDIWQTEILDLVKGSKIVDAHEKEALCTQLSKIKDHQLSELIEVKLNANNVLIGDMQEEPDSEAAKLKMEYKVTFMSNRQPLNDVYVLLFLPRRFWELVYVSKDHNLKLSHGVGSNIRSEEIVWLILMVVILKLYLDDKKHMTSMIFDEIGLLSFDPGGISIFQKAGNYLFPNYGILLKNEAANDRILLNIARLKGEGEADEPTGVVKKELFFDIYGFQSSGLVCVGTTGDDEVRCSANGFGRSYIPVSFRSLPVSLRSVHVFFFIPMDMRDFYESELFSMSRMTKPRYIPKEIIPDKT